jgi:hypothetical protein
VAQYVEACLGQVRARAEDLKRSLDQIITALELYADRVLWSALHPAPSLRGAPLRPHQQRTCACMQPRQLTTPCMACRGDALDKFGVVNLQLRQLSEELRPLLKFYAAHPKVPPPSSHSSTSNSPVSHGGRRHQRGTSWPER